LSSSSAPSDSDSDLAAMRSLLVVPAVVAAAPTTNCHERAADPSTCTPVSACEGNCQHPWCSIPDDNEFHKCKWKNAECEARGGCLDYSEALKDCDENCRGPDCKVCLFTTKNVLDETRAVEGALQEANANYELIFDHPSYPIESLPKVVPSDPRFWHQRTCNVNDPSCHVTVGPGSCSAHDRADSDSSYYFLASEFDTCQEAYDAALRYSQAKYGEIHIPAVPMADNDPLCTDVVDPDVAWEFGNTRYESCLAALRAAQAVEKADNPDYSCSA